MADSPDLGIDVDVDVDTELDEVREELRSITRRVLEQRCPIDRVRSLANDPIGFDEPLWREAAELGWLGLEIPESYGGAGMSFAELAVVLDELGRGLVPLPVLSSVVLGTSAILVGGSNEQRSEWLPALAAGERRLAVAMTGESGRVGFEALGVAATIGGGGVHLAGDAGFVADAHVADALVVAARVGESIQLMLVPAGADGVRVTVELSQDQTRRLATVEFDGVKVAHAARLSGGDALYDWLIDRAAIALAIDSHGGARRAMETTVQYAKDRIQFGRPVGSFQAVKHRCANMFVNVETSRVAADVAARTLPVGPGKPSRWASIAKSHAADAYVAVADSGIRVHGGIGFTWEHDMHLYLRRAKLNQALFGSSLWHRERLAEMLVAERSGRGYGS